MLFVSHQHICNSKQFGSCNQYKFWRYCTNFIKPKLKYLPLWPALLGAYYFLRHLQIKKFTPI